MCVEWRLIESSVADGPIALCVNQLKHLLADVNRQSTSFSKCVMLSYNDVLAVKLFIKKMQASSNSEEAPANLDLPSAGGFVREAWRKKTKLGSKS